LCTGKTNALQRKYVQVFLTAKAIQKQSKSDCDWVGFSGYLRFILKMKYDFIAVEVQEHFKILIQ